MEPSEDLVRDENDLRWEVGIPYTRAILGDRVDLELLDEEIRVEIPPGTQPGDEILVPGKGVSYVGRPGRGDLYVVARVALPRSLDDEERDLLERLDRLRRER